MSGFDHQFDQLVGRLVALDEDHLRTRHHDVPDLHVRDRQHAFEHDQRIAVEKAALAGLAQVLDQFGKIRGSPDIDCVMRFSQRPVLP